MILTLPRLSSLFQAVHFDMCKMVLFRYCPIVQYHTWAVACAQCKLYAWPREADVKRVRFDRVPPCVALEGQAVQDSKHQNMSIHSKRKRYGTFQLQEVFGPIWLGCQCCLRDPTASQLSCAGVAFQGAWLCETRVCPACDLNQNSSCRAACWQNAPYKNLLPNKKTKAWQYMWALLSAHVCSIVFMFFRYCFTCAEWLHRRTYDRASPASHRAWAVADPGYMAPSQRWALKTQTWANQGGIHLLGIRDVYIVSDFSYLFILFSMFLINDVHRVSSESGIAWFAALPGTGGE